MLNWLRGKVTAPSSELDRSGILVRATADSERSARLEGPTSPKGSAGRNLPSAKVSNHDARPSPIVVVHDGATTRGSRRRYGEGGGHDGLEGGDDTMITLDGIPRQWPLVRGSADPNHTDTYTAHLDWTNVKVICERFEIHLRRCADAVSFDQNSIAVRIKEVEEVMRSRSNSLADRRRQMNRWNETLSKCSDLSMSIDKLAARLEDTSVLATQLNNLLPSSSRLEELDDPDEGQGQQ